MKQTHKMKTLWLKHISENNEQTKKNAMLAPIAYGKEIAMKWKKKKTHDHDDDDDDSSASLVVFSNVWSREWVKLLVFDVFLLLLLLIYHCVDLLSVFIIIFIRVRRSSLTSNNEFEKDSVSHKIRLLADVFFNIIGNKIRVSFKIPFDSIFFVLNTFILLVLNLQLCWTLFWDRKFKISLNYQLVKS